MDRGSPTTGVASASDRSVRTGGLDNMRVRAALISAEIEITHDLKKGGTRVLVKVPFPRTEPGRRFRAGGCPPAIPEPEYEGPGVLSPRHQFLGHLMNILLTEDDPLHRSFLKKRGRARAARMRGDL